MAGKRIAVISPDGQFGTVDEADAEAVTKAGGRVLSSREVAEREVQQRYDALPTAQKILGGVNTAASALTGNPLLVGTDPNAPPTIAAYGAGVRQGLTGGLHDGATRQLADAVGGQAAGEKLAARIEQEREVSPVAHGAGELVGMVGGAVLGESAALRALPSAGIASAGAATEAATARALGGLAARGALGRAAAAGLSLGARGAVEGALYGAGQAAGEAMLQDHDLAADKLFASMGEGALWGGAAGAGLGAAGSLASSAIQGGKGVLARAAQRALSRGESVADDVARTAEGQAAHAAPTAQGPYRGQAPRAVEPPAPKPGVLAELGTLEGGRGLAYDQAWKAIGAGNGLQSTAYAKRAAKYLPNGTRDVGEVLMRKGVINAELGALEAAKNGTPAAMLPRITEELELVGKRIGEITDASPARIPAARIDAAIESVATPYSKQAGFRHVADQVRGYGDELRQVLGVKNPEQTVTIQQLLEQRKALDRLVYQEAKTLDPKGRVAALRELRTELEGVITNSLDDASGKVAGELRAEYKTLKHDYQALSIASEAAEDSAARMSKAASLGLRDMIFGGSNVLAAVGHKVVRERGNAVAAVLLHQAAESGSLARLVGQVDNQIAKASRGLLTAPAKRPLPELPKGTPRERAVTAMRRVADLQADPQGFAERVGRETAPIAESHPELAQAITSRRVQAVTFLASKMPVQPDRDPFDPHPAPRMSDAQAHEFSQFAWYAERPARFFEELEHGKITPEGVEVARALMPRAFEELQMRTMDALATQMARGKAPPYEQRLRIGNLLGIEAVPAQRPQHMLFLQQNVQPQTDDATLAGASGAGPSKHKPVKLPIQQSRYDRLEES